MRAAYLAAVLVLLAGCAVPIRPGAIVARCYHDENLTRVVFIWSTTAPPIKAPRSLEVTADCQVTIHE